VPALSSTFSALGCCLSELAIDDVRTCLARLDEADWPRIERELEGLVGEIAATLENGHGALRVARSLELRYRHQNDALEVAVNGVSSPAALRAAFHDRHRSEFGYATDEQVEVTAARARVWIDEGAGWAAPAPAPPGDVELGETVFGPVFRRGAVELAEGPAVLADALSTVVVWPGQTARTDEDGNVWLERA
jgi:N-methylhydantoinase A